MSEVGLPFAREEYAARLAKTRAAMDAAGVELLFAADPSNMAWLTGYDGWSFYVPQGVLVPPAGEPALVGAQPGRGRGAPDGVHGPRQRRRLPRPLRPDHRAAPDGAPRLRHLGARLRPDADRGRDGQLLLLGRRLTRCSGVASRTPSFVDATGLVNWERAVKSPRELDYMRTAGRIVTRMHERIEAIAEPGPAQERHRGRDPPGRDRGAAGRGRRLSGHHALASRPARMPQPPTSPGPTSRSAPGRGPSSRLRAAYRRYHCPLCRTVFLGEPPARVRRAEATLLEAMEEGLGRARAGNTCGDVAGAFFGTLEKHGIHKDSRAGYPIGLSYPPDWGERTFSIRRSDRTELRSGMTIHFMTALWFDDWGLEVTESIVVGDGAPEILAKRPPPPHRQALTAAGSARGYAAIASSPRTGLLPDMGVDLGRHRLLLFGRERRRRQAGVDLVEDEDLDLRLGLFLLPEAIELLQARRDRSEQVPACLLDPLPFGPSEIFLLQEVEQGKLVLGETLLDRAPLFRVQLFHQLHQPPKGLLDGDAVLLAVVVGDDLFVPLLVVHPRRIAGQHLVRASARRPHGCPEAQLPCASTFFANSSRSFSMSI